MTYKRSLRHDQAQRFSIRKSAFGAASVLLGTVFLLGTGVTVAADTAGQDSSAQVCNCSLTGEVLTEKQLDQLVTDIAAQEEEIATVKQEVETIATEITETYDLLVEVEGENLPTVQELEQEVKDQLQVELDETTTVEVVDSKISEVDSQLQTAQKNLTDLETKYKAQEADRTKRTELEQKIKTIEASITETEEWIEASSDNQYYSVLLGSKQGDITLTKGADGKWTATVTKLNDNGESVASTLPEGVTVDPTTGYLIFDTLDLAPKSLFYAVDNKKEVRPKDGVTSFTVDYHNNYFVETPVEKQLTDLEQARLDYLSLEYELQDSLDYKEKTGQTAVVRRVADILELFYQPENRSWAASDVNYNGEETTNLDNFQMNYTPDYEKVSQLAIAYLTALRELNGFETQGLIVTQDALAYALFRARELHTNTYPQNTKEGRHATNSLLTDQGNMRANENLSQFGIALQYLNTQYIHSDQELAYYLLLRWFSEYANAEDNYGHAENLFNFNDAEFAMGGMGREYTYISTGAVKTVNGQDYPDITGLLATGDITKPDKTVTIREDRPYDNGYVDTVVDSQPTGEVKLAMRQNSDGTYYLARVQSGTQTVRWRHYDGDQFTSTREVEFIQKLSFLPNTTFIYPVDQDYFEQTYVKEVQEKIEKARKLVATLVKNKDSKIREEYESLKKELESLGEIVTEQDLNNARTATLSLLVTKKTWLEKKADLLTACLPELEKTAVGFKTSYVADPEKDFGYESSAGGENGLTVTLTVNGEKKTFTVKKPVDKEVTKGTKAKTETKVLKFATIYVADETLKKGQTQVEVEGKDGSQTTTTTYTLDEKTGEVTANKPTTVTTAAVDRVVKVGTEPTTVTSKVAYATEYQADDTLKAGERETVQDGVAGEQSVETTYTVDDTTGELIGTEGTPVVTKAAVTKIVKVGTKPTVATSSVAYATEYEADDTLTAGEKVEKQAGVNGEQSVTITYTVNAETGELTEIKGTPVVTKTAVTKIVKVGTKPTVSTSPLVYTTEYQSDDNSEAGKKVIAQSGINGEQSVTTTYTVNAATGELTATAGTPVVTKAAVTEIVKVGTKPTVSTSPLVYTTEYQSDDNSEAGKKVIAQSGINGEQSVTTTYTVNAKTGELAEIKGTPVVTKTAVTEIVKVGTKPTVSTSPLVYTTEYQSDDNSEAGKKVIAQSGINGEQSVTTTYTVNAKTGELTEIKGTPVVTKTAVTETVKVGTKPTVSTEEVPFETKTIVDASMTVGDAPRLVQAGVVGTKTITTTYTIDAEGNLIPKVEESLTAPIDEIIALAPTETQVKNPVNPSTGQPETKSLTASGAGQAAGTGVQTGTAPAATTATGTEKASVTTSEQTLPNTGEAFSLLGLLGAGLTAAGFVGRRKRR